MCLMIKSLVFFNGHMGECTCVLINSVLCTLWIVDKVADRFNSAFHMN